MLYAIDHPFIAGVLGYFEEDGKLYVMMEFAPDGDVFQVGIHTCVCVCSVCV